MEEDASTPGWTKRAACRWVTYCMLWTLAVCVGLVSAYHPVLRIVAGLLGCLLAISLPILFATLFEITYARRDKSGLPIMCFPFLGSVVVAIGMIALLQASSFLVIFLSSTTVDSVHMLSDRFAGKDRQKLPRTVCIKHAFVKTEWEAGKLMCKSVNGHVQCAPAFVAAPIFDDKVLSDAGLSEEIYAWAVTQGQHVDTNYRKDGSLCGYLVGRMELDYHMSDYRLAITRVIQKHQLTLGKFAAPGLPLSSSEARPAAGLQFEAVAGAGPAGAAPIPLEGRPLLLTAEPLEVTHTEQAWLALGLVLLICCPCAGPIPVAIILGFACWSRSGRYGPVSPDDDEEDPSGDFDARGFHGSSGASEFPRGRLGKY